MIEAEMEEPLGHEKSARNSRNGYKSKKVRIHYGEFNVAFPKAEYQRCIVHQVRNTLKYVNKIKTNNNLFLLIRVYVSKDRELAISSLYIFLYFYNV